MPNTDSKPKSSGAELAESIAAEIGEDELRAALTGEDLFTDDAADAQDDAADNGAQSAQGGGASNGARAGTSSQGATGAQGSKAQAKQGAGTQQKQAPKTKQGGSRQKPAQSASRPATGAERIASAISVLERNATSFGDEEFVDEEISAERFAMIERPSGQLYRPRRVANMTDVELLRKAREVGIPVLLSGYPGTGKTALVEAAFDGEVITMNGNADMEKADFMGSYVFRAGEPGKQPEPQWVDGPLVRAMKEGKVLFVDDCTLVPANVISVLYPLMDGRNRIILTDHESEEIVAAEGFYVCGAHNPGAPGAIMAEALSSRFGVQMTVESDLNMARDLFGVDTRIIGVAAELHKMRREGQISWAPEMRELVAFKRNCEVFGIQVAVNNLISVAPEDAQGELASRLRSWFNHAEPLRHSG